jgi:hypothetical protein
LKEGLGRTVLSAIVVSISFWAWAELCIGRAVHRDRWRTVRLWGWDVDDYGFRDSIRQAQRAVARLNETDLCQPPENAG